MTKWLVRMSPRRDIAIVVMALLGLIACSPNDTRIKSVKQLLDEGEVLEFKEPGFRHGGCKGKPAYKLRVADEKERSRVVVGKQGSIISLGIYNCYTVGSRVPMEIGRNEKHGQVVINKISWARIEKVSKSRMKGRYFASNEQYYDYYNGVKSLSEKIKQPYVAIVDFTYVGGTAVDEKTLIDSDKQASQGDAYKETTEDGKCLVKCNRDETAIPVPADWHQPILERKLTTWFRLGQKNDYRQGQEADIKIRWDDKTSIARVKIKKVKSFRIWALDKYLSSDGYDLTALKRYIFDLNNGTKERPGGAGEEFISLIEFEVITGSLRHASCSTLHVGGEKSLERVTIARDEACMNSGSVINVVTVNNDDETLQIPVRVRERMDSADSTTTTLILERLDGLNQEQP